MTQDRWIKAALTDESLVANLLLRIKHPLDSNSLHTISKQQITEPVIVKSIPNFPSRWGNRKNRSKFTASVTGKEQRGSPTTHLSWSGGSISDESSRPSDLVRSVKANKIASTSSYYNKSHKRKVFLGNQESTSTRMNLNQQLSTSQNLKKLKINYGQTARNKTGSCRVEAEIEPQERAFVLPDLNMTPNDEDLMTMMVS